MERMVAHDSVDMFVAILPHGADNAIKRADLTKVCVVLGLVNEKCKDKDRAMRHLLHRARLGCCILSLPTGGYYRPTKEEADQIRRRNEQERKRAINTFAATKYDGQLYEDYRRGVL